MNQNISIQESDLQIDHLTASLVVYIPVVILVQGTITNILSAVVFLNLSKFKLTHIFQPQASATPGFRASRKGIAAPIYFYLFLLAVFDLGVLLFGLFNDCLYHLTSFELKHQSALICKLFTFLAYLFSHCSSVMTSMIVLLRFLFIHWAASAVRFFKVGCLKKIILIQIGVLAILNSHLFWNMKLGKQSYFSAKKLHSNDREFQSRDNLECQITETSFSKLVWPITDKLIYCIIPFVSIIFCNIFILKDLKKNKCCMKLSPKLRHRQSDSAVVVYRRNLNRIKMNITETDLSSNAGVAQKILNDLNERYKEALQFKQNQIIEKRFTFMLISISVVFLILTFPIVCIYF